jgi:hypothetical protein
MRLFFGVTLIPFTDILGQTCVHLVISVNLQFFISINSIEIITSLTSINEQNNILRKDNNYVYL